MKRKDNLIQIIGWLVSAILLVVLVVVVLLERKKYRDHIMEIQQQIQLQEDAESVDFAEMDKEVFGELVSTLKLRNFVCWGDNEMAGEENLSLADELEHLSNVQLRKWLEDDFSDILSSESDKVPTITAHNVGVSNEGMREILVRAGVDELEVGEWALIPSEKQSINLVLRDKDHGDVLHFAEQEGIDFGNVRISEVEGKLVVGDGEYDEDHPRFAFLRNEEGESFQVGTGTKVEIELASDYIGCVPVLFFGEESVESIDEFVSDLEKLIERYTDYEEDVSLKDQTFVVICTTEEDSELNEALQDTFGSHYIRNNVLLEDMTKQDYEDLAQVVLASFDAQGAFREIKEAILNAAQKKRN